MSYQKTSLSIQHLSFKYPEATEALFSDLSASFSTGWTGIVGPNGSGKSSLLHLVNGDLTTDTGHVIRPELVRTVQQRTDSPPHTLNLLADPGDASVWHWRSRLGIQPDWFDRWSTLSHGERKRLQLANALVADPDVLVLDEPDNHLDTPTRDMLLKALMDYTGIGLIVSHDRHLLDNLCSYTLFLRTGQADLRPGGYSAAKVEFDREQLELLRQRESLRKEERKLQRELQRRTRETDRSAGKRSRKHLARGDSDGRAKIGLAILSGKDATAGRLKRRMADRVEKIRDHRLSVPIEKVHPSGIHIDGGSGHRHILIDEKAGSLHLGESFSMSWPDLTLRRGQRIALTGPNGSGKSQLLHHIMKTNTLPDSEILYMPQEIPLTEGSRLLNQLHDLKPEAMSLALAIVRRLGSDPEALLQGDVISPGESRKLLLALGMSRECSLLVLDEPTNHLDLQAIACLEEALLEWPGGILLVSHDRSMVSRVVQTVWRLKNDKQGKRGTILTIT